MRDLKLIVNANEGKRLYFIASFKLRVDEQVNERVRNKLKDIISGAIGRGALSAPLLFVSPYIAAFGVLGAELLSFLSDILGEELAEKIRGKLGVRKYSEEDVREIFEIAKRDEDVREGLARLMNELIDEKLLKEIVGGERGVSEGDIQSD